MGRRQQFLGASLAVVMALPMTAHAESFPSRDTSYVDVNTCSFSSRQVRPASGSVPSNLPFIAFIAGPLGARASTAELVRQGTSERVPLRPEFDRFTGELRYFLEATMVEGATYDFVDPVCADRPRGTTTYTVTAPIPEPTSLGTLNTRVYAHYPALGLARNTFAEIRLAPDASMRPWFGVYTWRLEGIEPAPGSRTLNDNDASLFWSTVIDCPRDTTVGPYIGYAQRMTGGPELASTRTATFACNDIEVLGADGARLNATEIEIYEEALRNHDAGVIPRDGGVSSIDGGRNTEPDTNPNCSCTTASSSRTSNGLLALVLSTLAMVITRRRHAR